jgi:hypothetical protein
MPVIATNTTENKLVINNENGVLTNDNPIDFCSAIEMIIARKYKNIEIQEKSLKYSWEYIVENKMIPYIDSLINSRSG